MIVEMHKTVFITADAFRDRAMHHPIGMAFVYATGDLAGVCAYCKEAQDLRDYVQKEIKRGNIAVTQRRRPDLEMTGGTFAFEYLATKRGP